MARYTIIVAAGKHTASLLIVLSQSKHCSDLLDAIIKRLPSLSVKLNLQDVDDGNITLHLGSQNGPLFDPKDLLSDVLPDSCETIYATLHVSIF